MNQSVLLGSPMRKINIRSQSAGMVQAVIYKVVPRRAELCYSRD